MDVIDLLESMSIEELAKCPTSIIDYLIDIYSTYGLNVKNHLRLDDCVERSLSMVEKLEKVKEEIEKVLINDDDRVSKAHTVSRYISVNNEGRDKRKCEDSNVKGNSFVFESYIQINFN